VKISIITVCYNADKTIKKTLESVLNQTINKLEYIIIDGKSNDSTIKIVKDYKDKFLNKGWDFQYLSEADNGIYDAMNKGVKLASGDYIYFLNSDDLLHDHEVLVNAESTITKFDFPKIMSYLNNIVDEDLDICVCNERRPVSLLTKTMVFCHQGLIAKRSLFNTIGYFDTRFRIYADWDWILRAHLRGVDITLSNDIIADFHTGGESWQNLHILEKHYVRQKNKVYLWIDTRFIYDIVVAIPRLTLWKISKMLPKSLSTRLKLHMK